MLHCIHPCSGGVGFCQETARIDKSSLIEVTVDRANNGAASFCGPRTSAKARGKRFLGNRSVLLSTSVGRELNLNKQVLNVVSSISGSRKSAPLWNSSNMSTVNNCDDVIKVSESDWCMLALIAECRNIIGNGVISCPKASIMILIKLSVSQPNHPTLSAKSLQERGGKGNR